MKLVTEKLNMDKKLEELEKQISENKQSLV